MQFPSFPPSLPPSVRRRGFRPGRFFCHKKPSIFVGTQTFNKRCIPWLDDHKVSWTKVIYSCTKHMHQLFLFDVFCWNLNKHSASLFHLFMMFIVAAVNQVIPVAIHRPRLSLWISDLHIFSIQHNSGTGETQLLPSLVSPKM